MRFLPVLFAAMACPFASIAAEPNALGEKEIADGWILLFDGESTTGWKIAGDPKATLEAREGVLTLQGSNARLEFTARPRFFEMHCEFRLKGSEGSFETQVQLEKVELGFGAKLPTGSEEWHRLNARFDNATVTCSVDGKELFSSPNAALFNTGIASRIGFTVSGSKSGKLELRNLKLQPEQTRSLFDGKSLAGWKVNEADPKRVASKFEVTKDGELHVTNGPGDLRTEAKYGDFVLQLECKTNGTALNSGIFFRCIPDQYQNGYEMQIQNAFKDGDRTKPTDFGTGAIYRRIAARKVVSNDKEWFAMTLIANGPHLATWVNGVQVVDWTDDRKPDENPRKGLRTEAGHLSIQGHDPTTDLLFRNLRIAELPQAR